MSLVVKMILFMTWMKRRKMKLLKSLRLAIEWLLNAFKTPACNKKAKIATPYEQKIATMACPNHPFDETQWIIRIRRILDEDIDQLGVDEPISIFNVPKPLLCTKPDAYVPQLVALGPYHHCRDDLHDMDMYKLSAAKRTQSQLPSLNFQQLVDAFATLEYRIRSRYHRHLNLSNEALAWMMAIDVSFLLEFIQTFSKNNKQRTLRRIPSRMSHLVDPSRKTSSHITLLRDIVMLENQIPLFLLAKATEMWLSSGQTVQSSLSSMLSGFFQEVCPLIGIAAPCAADITRHAHLLDFLYSNMVPCCAEESCGDMDQAGEESQHCNDHTTTKRTLNSVTGLLVRRGVKLASMVMDFMFRTLLRFVASLPCMSVLRQPIEQMALQASDPRGPAPSDLQNRSTSPLLEEIAVPSVAELAYAGVRFSPANGGVSAIEFCARTSTLRVPVIRTDETTEVVLRNMVAYEASSGARALVLARYIELMNGIIDTEEDARLLRDCGIILNHLRSDQEVADLWNGMTRSVSLTRVPALDRVIDDLNRHYDSCWKVRTRAFVKAHVLGSKDLIACVVVVLLFIFISLQAFCVSRGCFPFWYRVTRGRKDGD